MRWVFFFCTFQCGLGTLLQRFLPALSRNGFRAFHVWQSCERGMGAPQFHGESTLSGRNNRIGFKAFCEKKMTEKSEKSKAPVRFSSPFFTFLHTAPIFLHQPQNGCLFYNFLLIFIWISYKIYRCNSGKNCKEG